jgi:hypothetical protein
MAASHWPQEHREGTVRSQRHEIHTGMAIGEGPGIFGRPKGCKLDRKGSTVVLNTDMEGWVCGVHLVRLLVPPCACVAVISMCLHVIMDLASLLRP